MNEETIQYLMLAYIKAREEKEKARKQGLEYTEVYEHGKIILIRRMFEHFKIEDRLPIF